MDDPNVIKIIVCFGLAIIAFIYIFYLRGKYIKQSLNNLLAFIVPKAGKGHFELLPIQGDSITLPPTRDKRGHTYTMSDISRVPVAFPINRPKFLQTTIDMAVFDAESWEPMTNRLGLLQLSPQRLYNLVNERFTNIGVEQALEEQEGRGKAPAKKGIKWSTVLIIFLVLGIIGMGVFLYSTFNELEALKVAAGVA